MHKQPLSDGGKRARQEAILEAVSSDSVSTQGDLVKALKRRGIEATQASVSRDIAELGLVKAQGRYRAAPPPASDPILPLRAYVLSVIPAGENLLVIKCVTGTAQQVGLAIDGMAKAGLAGTIAGDDTVFAAAVTKTATRELADFLKMTALAAHGVPS